MRWLLALMALTLPAQSEVASVLGGEHPEFTRIVVAAAAPGDWRFGRTPDGYELALGDSVTGYDLSRAFDRIPKDRVSGLYRDPLTGRLRMALSCPCYAVAFEFRPGTVVIDIKPGTPPEGSSFELAIDTGASPEPAAEVAPTAPPGADRPGYDWIAIARGEVPELPPEAPPPAVPLPLPAGGAALDPLRDALLAQISKGVAEGVVELAEGGLNQPGTGASEGPWMRITVGDLPGLIAGSVRDPDPALAADGAACLPDSALALDTWGGQGPVAEQLAPARHGMVTEFDAPVDDAILRAARHFLSLGFGAEARQVLDLRSDPLAGEGALLATLSHIVDLEPAPLGLLAGQDACDTAAALWRLLAEVASGGDDPLPLLNLDAVARSFSALPAHLRRYLGPPLVAHFLARGQEEIARQLRDAILRAPGTPGPYVALMEAEFQLSQGDPDAAARVAGAVRDDQGIRDLAATLALVQAALAGGPALPPDVPGDLEAQLGVIDDPTETAQVLQALAASLALTGQPDRAFAVLPRTPDSFDLLWKLSAAAMPEDLLLTEAVPAATAGLRSADPATNLVVATRLEAAGFPAQALAWLGPLPADVALQTVLLAARAHLALRDAPAALAVLSGRSDPAALELRARAVLQLGDAPAAAEAYARAGDADGLDRARRLGADWAGLAGGAEPWATAASLAIAPTASIPGGPIAQATALADASAAARAAVEALLMAPDVSG